MLEEKKLTRGRIPLGMKCFADNVHIPSLAGLEKVGSVISLLTSFRLRNTDNTGPSCRTSKIFSPYFNGYQVYLTCKMGHLFPLC